MEREEFKGSVKFQDALNDFSLKRDGFNKEINKIGEKWTIKKECILTDLEKEVEFLKDAKAKALEDYQKFGLRFDMISPFLYLTLVILLHLFARIVKVFIVFIL